MGIEEAHGGFGAPRFLAAGVPASCLVLSALLLERPFGVTTTSKAVLLAGESSYVLYLIHPYVIYGALRTLLAPRGELPLPAVAALVCALMLASTVAAIAVHLWFEKPVMSRLRRQRLQRPASSPVQRQGPAPILVAAAPLSSRTSAP
jgi:peptidoglycan/LPS O-acetylase OafA/YrhL